MMCREVSSLLPLFFDGELEPRQMRVVALHSTRCSSCEVELRQLERVQELVSENIRAGVDEIDLGDFWPSVERQLTDVRPPRWARIMAWWDDGGRVWALRVPAFAAAAAIAVLAFVFFTRVPPAPIPPAPPQLAAADNAASIDSLETDVDSVAVLNDPETRTTVLWLSDETSTPGDTP